MSLEKIDRLIDGEQYEAARAALDEALDVTGDPTTRWRLDRRRARLMLGSRTTPVDEAVFLLEDLVAAEAAPDDEVPDAHALLIHCYAVKRCRPIVEQVAAAARERCGGRDVPALLVAEGRAAMTFDDRPRARELLQRALELDPSFARARCALADLHYVLGDFTACHEHLDQVPPGDPQWPRAARIRASCFAAVSDAESETRVWQELVERLPESDFVQQNLVALGLALAAGGRRSDALERFREAWRMAPDTGQGGYARKRIEYLERAAPGETESRKHLPAFPTTSQKWDYCGPAVLELCLRYLDLELNQDEIAEEVKREVGTPMCEIVSFLRTHDIVSRRIEATAERLKAAIDLGLPVIVQEEYSTTTHVAVITGYDEALGLFIAADPATHRPLLKSFEWTEQAGALFGNGGVIVLGHRGPSLEALEREADTAGLVEARHLVLLDECDLLRPRAGSQEQEAIALEEVIRLCNEALDLAPGFKLAWHRRFYAYYDLFRMRGWPELRTSALADLHQARTRFHADEWPHQLHGHWLLDEGRFQEALVEYFEASSRDPGDANNLQAMGECGQLSGDLAKATRHMLDALALEPYQMRAHENLAGTYLRQLQEADAEAAPSGDPPTMDPRVIRVPVDLPEEALERRALHFNRVARVMAPRNPYNHEVHGELLARRGDWEGAVAAFRDAFGVTPDRLGSIWGLARALEQLDELDEARTLLEGSLQRKWHVPGAWLHLADFLDRRDDAAGGAAVLRKGIETLDHGREQLVSRLYELLEHCDGAEAAAAQLRELAERRLGDNALVSEVTWTLDDHHQRGHAIAMMRHVVELSPGNVQAVYRLGWLLSLDLLTRDEGAGLLEQCLELAPNAWSPRRDLAWLLVERDPARGLDLLRPCLDRQDPYIYETQAALLAALDRPAEAAEAMALALEALGAPDYGFVELARWHLDAHRYDRALELARHIYDQPVAPDLTDFAQRIWAACHRLAGAAAEILPRLRELCADEVPQRLAYEVYWGCRALDHDLAARAALVTAEDRKDPVQRVVWRIRAAQERAKTGDDSLLGEVLGEVGESAEAWAQLSYSYEALHRYDEANQAAERAYAIDPRDREALSAMEEAHVRRGRIDDAIQCAKDLMEHHPYEHHGPERLGALLAKSLEVEPALELTHRAIEAAPYCHNAHWARSVALFVAGDLDGARGHAERCLALEAPDEEDPPNDCVMILRALSADVSGVERCLTTLHAKEPPTNFAALKQMFLDTARG